MDRRRFLGLAGATLVAGCATSSGGDDGTPSPTETPPATAAPTGTATPRPTPTATSTPEPTATTPVPIEPRVILSNPVSRWTGFGDAVSNAVSSVGEGARLPVSGQFNIWVHDGTIDYTSRIRAFDTAGDQVAVQSFSDEKSVGEEQYMQWESFVALDTTGWDRGRYTGEYTVRDNVIEDRSDPAQWAVEIVAPLSGDGAALVGTDIPETLPLNERVEYTLTLANRTDRDSSIVSPISRRSGGRWTEVVDEATINVPGGRSVRFPLTAKFSEAGVYEYRLDTVDVTWSVTVGDS